MKIQAVSTQLNADRNISGTWLLNSIAASSATAEEDGGKEEQKKEN